MRRRAMSQSLINLLRILLQQIQPRRQLKLLNRQLLLIRQRLILRACRLLIRQQLILRVRRLLIRPPIHQLIHQPRRQRNFVRVINHAPSCAQK